MHAGIQVKTACVQDRYALRSPYRNSHTVESYLLSQLCLLLLLANHTISEIDHQNLGDREVPPFAILEVILMQASDPTTVIKARDAEDQFGQRRLVLCDGPKVRSDWMMLFIAEVEKHMNVSIANRWTFADYMCGLGPGSPNPTMRIHNITLSDPSKHFVEL
jgi:hypothetical protein